MEQVTAIHPISQQLQLIQISSICLLIINIHCPSSHLATARASDSSLALDYCARYQVFVCMYVTNTDRHDHATCVAVGHVSSVLCTVWCMCVAGELCSACVHHQGPVSRHLLARRHHVAGRQVARRAYTSGTRCTYLQDTCRMAAPESRHGPEVQQTSVRE